MAQPDGGKGYASLQTCTEASGGSRVERILGALVVLIAFAHCTQLDIARPLHSIMQSLGLPGSSILEAFRLSPSDFLVWLAFAILLIHTARRRRGHDAASCPLWKQVPVAAILLLFWIILSLVPALKGREAQYITVNLRAGLVDLVQFAEFFAMAYLLFIVILRREKILHTAMLALLAGATLSVLLAWYQYLQRPEEVPAMKVAGAFGNRNLLGAYLAVTVPLILGYSLWGDSRLLRTWARLLAVAALGVVLAGGQFFALVAGILVVLYLFRRWLLLPVGVAVILGFVLVLPHLPRCNSKLLFESVALYHTEDGAKALGGSLDKARRDSAQRKEMLAEVQKLLRSERGRNTNQELFISMPILPGEADYSWPWQQRYQEWQAAANMMLASPLFGVGAGSYQMNVNVFYQYELGMPLPAKYAGVNLMEPDALSMYAVLGACLGFPALLFLCWFLLRAFHRAAIGFQQHEGRLRGIAAGCIGALVALTVSGIFTDFLVRGLGISLALVLALSAVAGGRREIETKA